MLIEVSEGVFVDAASVIAIQAGVRDNCPPGLAVVVRGFDEPVISSFRTLDEAVYHAGTLATSINAILAAAPTPSNSRWTFVRNAKPPHGACLTKDTVQRVREGYYNPEIGFICPGGCTITHWAPMPEGG